ncbi:unnamed protein product [Rhizophagus irregularis]|nr:unnamed protein product [Rhizophagus irregularis]
MGTDLRAKADDARKTYRYSKQLPILDIMPFLKYSFLVQSKLHGNSAQDGTGIPQYHVVSKSQAERLLTLSESLHRRVIGQDEAVDAVFQTHHSVARLHRSTPRYVGHDEGAQLTEAIGQGRHVDFSNTVIILTRISSSSSVQDIRKNRLCSIGKIEQSFRR